MLLIKRAKKLKKENNNTIKNRTFHYSLILHSPFSPLPRNYLIFLVLVEKILKRGENGETEKKRTFIFTLLK